MNWMKKTTDAQRTSGSWQEEMADAAGMQQ
jgi:hypothetical protein